MPFIIWWGWYVSYEQWNAAVNLHGLSWKVPEEGQICDQCSGQGLRDLASVPSSATNSPCDLGHITQSLCLSSSSVKEGNRPSLSSKGVVSGCKVLRYYGDWGYEYLNRQKAEMGPDQTPRSEKPTAFGEIPVSVMGWIKLRGPPAQVPLPTVSPVTMSQTT